MENVAISRRDHTYKKGNKENAQPSYGSKSFIKRDKTSAPPFQLKTIKKQETLSKNGPLKVKTKQTDMRSLSGEALQMVKTVQRNGKGAPVTDVKQHQTHSQAFLAEQALKHKKIDSEAPKPPAALSKSALGMYKGKIVQSKIGSIWKSSGTMGGVDAKPSAPRTENEKVGNVTKSRSKSVTELAGHDTENPAPTRSKSVSDRPAHVSKPAVTSRRPAGFCSARPPARAVPATLASTSNRSTNVAPTKRSGTQKPKIPVTDKVSKPPVTSTISHYRFTVETAEERRAKLAQWQVSKGKTFKRPAMTIAASSKTKVSSAKPEADVKLQSQPAAQHTDPEPEPSLDACKTNSAHSAAHSQGAELATHSQTPTMVNTTLDLLENSDAALPVDPQDRVDDVVVNLCDALEAMATPSRCNDECSEVCNSVETEVRKPKDECKQEDVSEQLKVEQVKDAVEESDDQEVESDDAEEVESDEGVMETTPQTEGASVVKYSVKTTPYLQSVKRTIEDEASTGTSRRKGNIKDLKFLTPVRRSCRIQRKSSHLPAMLVDHDPCVSSLAELVKLDEDSNAYIYRKNPALLEGLPDQP